MKQVTIWMVYVASLCATLSQSALAQVTYSASELAELNAAYWSSIRSIDLTYTQETLAGGKLVDISPQVIRWTMSGDRDRLRFSEKVPNDEVDRDAPQLYKHDWYYDGTDTFHLFGQDVGKEPSSEVEGLRMSLHGDVHAGFDDEFTDNHPAYTWLAMKRLLMRFGNTFRPNETFCTFVQDNVTSTPERSLASNGDSLWSFRISPSPDNDANRSQAPHVEVVVNESKGFLIQNISYYLFEPIGPKNEKTISSITELGIEEYAEVDDRFFFPKKVVQRLYNPSTRAKSEAAKVFKIDRLKVNEELQDDLFAFKIPPFVPVRHHPAVESPNGKSYVVVSVWGPNNKPMRTYSEPGEYDAHREALYEESKNAENVPPETGFSNRRVAIGITGLTAVLLALLLARHFKR